MRDMEIVDRQEKRAHKTRLGRENRKQRKNWRCRAHNEEENLDMVRFQKFGKQKGY